MTRVQVLALVLGMLPGGLSAAPAEPDDFEVIAHRGASAYAPENTLAAFAAALAQGALHLELDVQLTRDNRVVVFHDRHLAPKTPAGGEVGDHDLAFLQTLDLAPWFRSVFPKARFAGGEATIPSLAQVFERFGAGPVYHVEIKSRNAALPVRVASLVERFELDSRVRVSSFDLDQLLRIREHKPELPLCWLLPRAKKIRQQLGADEKRLERELPRLRRAAIDRAAASRIPQVGLPALEIEAALVAYARDRGVDVRAWRVRDLAALEAAWRAGASGATVDWPGRALERLRRREGRAR